MSDECDRIVAAAADLEIEPRGKRWAHASLCVLDAVFSIRAHYDHHVVPMCNRYAAWAGLHRPLVDSPSVPLTEQQELPEFLAHMREYGDADFATKVLVNGQRTSTHGKAPLKAEAARRYAEILTGHGLRTLSDARSLLEEQRRLATVEQELASVPGHGSGARLGYLWMLMGDDARIKPDSRVLRRLSRVLQRNVSPKDAVALLTEAARRIGCTPWELDHAVWRYQRK